MKRRLVIALGGIGILLACVLLAPVPPPARWAMTLHDAAHAPVFGGIALLILFGVRAHARLRASPAQIQYALALLGTVALGVATEWLQIPSGRDASAADLGRDVLGAVAFLGIAAAVDARTARIRMPALLLSVALLTVLAVPLVHAALEYRGRAQAFPVLAEFERGLDEYFLSARRVRLASVVLPEDWRAAAGEAALHVRFLAEPHPGVHFDEPMPDWRGYETLAVDLINPGEAELVLGLRVHDTAHDQRHEDRFNLHVRVPAGSRRVIRVPLADIAAGPRGRRLDLAQVAGVVLFRAEGSAAQEMYVARVWLDRSAT